MKAVVVPNTEGAVRWCGRGAELTGRSGTRRCLLEYDCSCQSEDGNVRKNPSSM